MEYMYQCLLEWSKENQYDREELYRYRIRCLLRTPHRVLVGFPYIVRFPLVDRLILHVNRATTNMILAKVYTFAMLQATSIDLQGEV